MDLENKIFLVTGSSKGIGEATVYALSKEKAKVVVTYNSDSEAAEEVGAKCKELGAGDVLVLKLDLKYNENIKNAISETEKKFGHIDFLINNAGVISWEKFEHETFEDVENQVRTNLEGLIKVTLAALPQIKEGIVNIASRAGHVPYPGRATYCATKYGVIGFTQSLALEYPDLKIFSVSPGATATQMWNFQEGADPAFVAEKIVEALKRGIPLKDLDLPVWEMN